MCLVRIAGSFLLLLTASGCCSVVAKSGDAKILRCPQLIHSPGTKYFRMELPTVSLAQAATNVMQVRDLPVYLVGLFRFDLSMPLKYEEDASEKDPPWRDARITIIFRRLDGAELCGQAFSLGVGAQRGDILGQHRWDLGWNLDTGCLSPPDRSYDIVVIVEQPSRRASDRIALRAHAFRVQMP